jgi:hypothetical protein
MKTITLHVGDKLRALVKNPFSADIPKGAVVTIVSFGHGNSFRVDEDGLCPIVEYDDLYWFTDMKELFRNYKKETK